MRQVIDSSEEGNGAKPMIESFSELAAGDFSVELARRIALAKGQTRLAPDLTLGLLHKLNNVMTSIYFTAEACESDIESDHPVREMLSDLTRAVRDAQQLINNTAEVNLTLGNTDAEYHDLNDLMRKELFLMKMLLPKSAVVEVETLPEPAYVRMCLADFRRVLFSIASNACDAAGEAPLVALHTVESAQLNSEEYFPKLPVQKENMVALVIRDNGHGMMPQTVAGAFSPFFTTRPDRMGLGLFHAQEVAQRNGGTLAIRRRVPSGAEVIWLMPRASA